MFLNDNFVVLQPYIFLGIFHYFGQHGRPAYQIFNPRLFFNYFNPDTRTFYFIKEINFIKQNWRKSRIKILVLKIELIVGEKILKLNFLPIYLIKLIFFLNKEPEYFFLYLCVKYKLIQTYFNVSTRNLSDLNNQSWLLSSQTTP